MIKNSVPIVLIPISAGVDLAALAVLLEATLKEKNIAAHSFAPIDNDSQQQNIAENLLAANRCDELLENIVTDFKLIAKKSAAVIVRGISLEANQFYAAKLNRDIARALSGLIIFVGAWQDNGEKLNNEIKIASNDYQDLPFCKIMGFIADKMPNNISPTHAKKFLCMKCPTLQSNAFSFIAGINFDPKKKAINEPSLAVDDLIKTLDKPYTPTITPPIFRQQLITLAQNANKKIVLPEGYEPRTLRAAIECTRRKIAECILLGDPQKIHAVAKKNSLILDTRIAILNPKNIAAKYLESLLDLRSHKGLTRSLARQQLKDPVVLATMMLHLNEVDGLVSGAIHTTANTIRPALQIIKTKANIKLASSIFFMCLPDQVLIFGDCAINSNPTSEELADIAIASADSAAALGIPPRVAMLSYSTGESASGSGVDKVRTATTIVKTKRPDLPIAGPIQYDAAINKAVAKLKAPQDKVAGNATVFIFPDLNSGNIACKAVQRSANIVCIGPMLQGLRKPVNDLSRGCLVEDIIFTIALTAVQANQQAR